MPSNLRPVYGIDWLGLSVSQDPVGAGMKFQAIPDAGNRFLSELDKRIYVMPANDSYLMITQGMTESTIKNKIGYAVNAWLAVQPSKPTVTFDKNSGSFIFKLPYSSYEDHVDFRGRLIEIEASDPSIKPYRTIVAPGSNEIRIPIEAIIYGSEDKASLAEQLLANGLVLSLQSMMRLMTRLPQPYEGLTISEKNGVFTFSADTGKIEDYKEHELFRNSVAMAMKAVNGTVSIEFRTDKGYQAATGFNMGELLDYLRYARKLYTTANTPYTREVEKYESTFTARISDVFGSDTVIDPDQVKDYRQVMNKSVATVSGPASESTPPFKGEGLEMMDTILPGTYTGEMFVSFTTNLVSSEYLKQFSRVTVVIDTNQTVQIIIVDETLYGKLGKTEIPGRFQYFEQIGEGDHMTYRALEGAFGSYSEDGTLVFNFIPARLKRR